MLKSRSEEEDDGRRSSMLRFVRSSRVERTDFLQKQTTNSVHRHSLTVTDLSTALHTSLLSLLNGRCLINSFECENDSPLAAGEYSFLIYGGQHLTLYNIDGELHRTSWNTNIYDPIKQLRWSPYHRGYLIMTARLFALFSSFSYELFPVAVSFPATEHLQLFTCHQMDLWLVCLVASSKRQLFVRYDLSEWERKEYDRMEFSTDAFGLHRTDTICAIENDRTGRCLALLVAERNQNVTVGIQRRRRLIVLSTDGMSPLRVIYFGGADDLYWTLTSVVDRQMATAGWLLSKWHDKELTFVGTKCHCIQYRSELRNSAVTVDGHYLVLRTTAGLDVYQIG